MVSGFGAQRHRIIHKNKSNGETMKIIDELIANLPDDVPVRSVLAGALDSSISTYTQKCCMVDWH
jgi:hypothetical protein